MSEVPAYGEEDATGRERRLIEFAWTRNRVVTTEELRSFGVFGNAVTLRVRQRRVTWMHRGVYLLGPGPPSSRSGAPPQRGRSSRVEPSAA